MSSIGLAIQSRTIWRITYEVLLCWPWRHNVMVPTIRKPTRSAVMLTRHGIPGTPQYFRSIG
jgi:hypothetical protein